MIAYAASIFAVGSSELDPYEGKLPTTKLIEPAFRLVVRQEWFNVNTGEPVPGYDPTTASTPEPAPMPEYPPTIMPPTGGGSATGFAPPPVGLKETPDRTTFMFVAHALLATVFGYAGSKFAVYVYRRQRPLVKAAGAE